MFNTSAEFHSTVTFHRRLLSVTINNWFSVKVILHTYSCFEALNKLTNLLF